MTRTRNHWSEVLDYCEAEVDPDLLCVRCGSDMYVPAGYEPSAMCNPCVQEMASAYLPEAARIAAAVDAWLEFYRAEPAPICYEMAFCMTLLDAISRGEGPR